MSRALDSTGLKVPMATTNLFSNPVFKEGAFTANDPQVRRYAVAKTFDAIDLGVELGASVYVMWGGREGTECDAAKDIRLAMPRFQGEHFAHNLGLLDGLAAIAGEQGCTMAQLVLAWLLAQGADIIPIPGTTRLDHLEENVRGTEVHLDKSTLDWLNALVNPRTVSGARYNAATQVEIDTEEVTLEA